jgi:hypothetical protein
MRNILVGVFIAMAGVPALAQVYKWVDANGVTHYSEKPPETGKAREVPLHDAAPAGSGTQANAGDPAWKDKERAYKQRQAARDQLAAKQQKEKADNEEKCKQSGAQLADMRAHPRSYQTNDKGEAEFLSDQQRDTLLAERQQEYNQHCN